MLGLLAIMATLLGILAIFCYNVNTSCTYTVHTRLIEQRCGRSGIGSG